jgi:hypothetical protein
VILLFAGWLLEVGRLIIIIIITITIIIIIKAYDGHISATLERIPSTLFDPQIQGSEDIGILSSKSHQSVNLLSLSLSLLEYGIDEGIERSLCDFATYSTKLLLQSIMFT